MATDARSVRDYDPAIRNVVLGETVRVMRAFGFAGAHVMVIGGLVPSLLVPVPELGLQPHVGTLDLDLCLSVAIVDGQVGAYERLEKSLRKLKFAPVRGESWRWQGGVKSPLVIEFFCPAAPGREPGKLHRPGGVVGGKLSAMVLEAGAAIDQDPVRVEVEVDLPGESGRSRHAVKVAGPGAFLVAKSRALVGRDHNKDAYDIVRLVEAWPGGQVALAKRLRSTPLHGDPLFSESISTLAREFATLDSAGAVKYARFLGDGAEERNRLARHAVGAVRVLLEELGSLERGAGAPW